MVAGHAIVEQDRYESEGASPLRDVAAAWVIAVLLLVGAIISVALDHYVTVSSEPVSTYEAAVKAAAGVEEDEDGPGDHDSRDMEEPASRRVPRP